MAEPPTRGSESCGADDRLYEAIAAYEAARDAQQKPSPEDYLAQYPEVADRLARYFMNQQDLMRLFESQETDAVEPAAEPEPFPDIPGYHVLERIAPGGMGIVYRAWQRTPGRMVALKVIRPDRLDGASPRQRRLIIERFRTEAQAAAQLEHDHIVGVFEVGEAGGRPYFSMRYVEGTSLGHLLEAHPLECRKAATYLEQVTRAVHEAHRHGILHRDLKPGNILLDTRTDRALVADFGLAKLQNPQSERTQTGGERLGTLVYMSPEQDQSPSKVTVVSDVYSLGATLYALLAGRPPFLGESDAETHRLIHEAEPPSLRARNPRVDRDLETICLKCLEKEPARRYDSAESLANDLRHWLEGEPIDARRTRLPEKVLKWARRKPAWAMVGGLVALLVGAAFIVPYVFAYREHQNALKLGRALRETKYQLALNQLDEGLSLLEEKGDGGHGLLKLADGLQTAPPDSQELARVIRTNLNGWYGRLSALRACWEQPAEVLAVAVSPDGKVALTGGADGDVLFWDTATGKQLPMRLHHGGKVRAIAFQSDGKRVLTGGTGGAKLWRLGQGDAPSLQLVHNGITDVYAVAFSRDSKLALTGGEDKKARLWDVATGLLRGESRLHEGVVRAVSFSPDGKLALSGDESGEVRFWDVDADATARQPLRHENTVYALALSPDGKLLATGGSDRTAKLWDLASGGKLSLPHRGNVFSVAFSPDGRFLLTGSEGKMARLWDVATGKPVGQPLRHRGAVHAVAFSPDSRFLLTGAADKSARYWEAASGKERGILFRHRKEVRALAFDADGARVLTGCGDGCVRLWNPVTPAKPVLELVRPRRISCVAISPDGKRILAGQYGHPAEPRHPAWLWDAATGQLIGQPMWNDFWVTAAAFSPDSGTAVTLDHRGTIRLWHAATGEAFGEPLPHLQAIRAMALGDDGQTLLTGCHENAAWIWNIRTQTKRHGLPHQGSVLAVALSPGGRWALTGSADRTAQLWSVETGELLGPPLKHEGEVGVVGFGGRGELFVTAGEDGTARLWEAPSGKSHCRPLRHADKVWAAVLAPDEKTVLTGGGDQDRTARFWDTATARPLGPALEFGKAVRVVAICPRGRRAAMGSDDGQVVLCDVPVPKEGTVEHLVLWTKVITGMELDDVGSVHVADTDTWRNWCQQLAVPGATPQTEPSPNGRGRE
jgi:WD40 repeat protein